MTTPVRRIVTGHDSSGKAVIQSDGEVPVVFALPALPGLAFNEVWNTAATPAPVAPSEADPTVGRKVATEPPANGTIIRVVEFPPENPQAPRPGPEQIEALLAQVGLHQARSKHSPPERHPFMHRTESIDYGVVLDGEIDLLLDEDEVHLTPGDIVVQRGTIHAWANRSGKPCRMLFVLIDGEYTGDLAANLP